MSKTITKLSVMWSLLWRSTLLAPIFFVTSTVLITAVCCVFVVPVLVTLCVLGGLWARAGIYAGIWLVCFGVVRSKWGRSVLQAKFYT